MKSLSAMLTWRRPRLLKRHDFLQHILIDARRSGRSTSQPGQQILVGVEQYCLKPGQFRRPHRRGAGCSKSTEQDVHLLDAAMIGAKDHLLSTVVERHIG